MTSHEIFMLTALVSTGIFLLQFVISVFFGDLDMDVDGDGGVSKLPYSKKNHKALTFTSQGFAMSKSCCTFRP